MVKITRIIFLIIACVMPIIIGGLHTATHFKDLMTSEIHQYLQKEVLILGQPQSLWNTFGVVSFMMGASILVLGLVNMDTYYRLSKTEYPPTLSIAAMISYQICVMYVGYTFEQGFQLYGGLVGSVLLFITLVQTIKSKYAVPIEKR